MKICEIASTSPTGIVACLDLGKGGGSLKKDRFWLHPAHQPEEPRRRGLPSSVIALWTAAAVNISAFIVGILAAGDVMLPAVMPVDKPPMPLAHSINTAKGNKRIGVQKIEKRKACRNAVPEQRTLPGGMPVGIGLSDLVAEQIHRQILPDGITQEIGVGIRVAEPPVSEHLERAAFRAPDMVEGTDPGDKGFVSGHILWPRPSSPSPRNPRTG